MTALVTGRLILRRWREADRAPFAQMNRDPRVMAFFPGLLTAEESNQGIDRIEAHFHQHGFGLWAVELREDSQFIGFIGLSIPRFEAAFTPCVEIGWRLLPEYWSRGLATEGAREAIRYGFEVLELREIVSFTVPANERSRRVMEKLGMSHDPADDFDHPLILEGTRCEGHPMRLHVLYRLQSSDWERGS